MCYARRQRSSWARIKLSNNCILNSFELKISNSSFILASFTFVWVYITLWRECISHFALLCTSLSVVQFSMTVLPALADSLTIISPFANSVNIQNKQRFATLTEFVCEFCQTHQGVNGCLIKRLVGQQGLEPRTDRLWAGSSNQLSYWPANATCLLYNIYFVLSIPFLKKFNNF